MLSFIIINSVNAHGKYYQSIYVNIQNRMDNDKIVVYLKHAVQYDVFKITCSRKRKKISFLLYFIQLRYNFVE